MGEYKADDGELIFVFVHVFEEYGKFLKAMNDSGKVPPESELGAIHERHSTAYEKYKGKPQEWFSLWRHEGKSIEAVADEMNQNAELLELFNYASAWYKSQQRESVIKSMIGNPAASEAEKELFNAVIRGLPVRVDDVRRTGSHAAMNLLRLEALDKRLEESFRAIDASAEPGAGDGAAERQFIGWRGTPEQLKELAEELQQEKFVASAEAFKAQFTDTEAKVEEPCRWLNTDRSLVHLLDKLHKKGVIPAETNRVNEAIAHFRKADGSSYTDSLAQNRNGAKDSAKSRGFETINNIVLKAFS